MWISRKSVCSSFSTSSSRTAHTTICPTMAAIALSWAFHTLWAPWIHLQEPHSRVWTSAYSSGALLRTRGAAFAATRPWRWTPLFTATSTALWMPFIRVVQSRQRIIAACEQNFAQQEWPELMPWLKYEQFLNHVLKIFCIYLYEGFSPRFEHKSTLTKLNLQITPI